MIGKTANWSDRYGFIRGSVITMRFATFALTSAVLAASCATGLALPRAHRGPTAPRISNKRSSKPVPKPQAQRGIDSGRATEIQTALIKSGYLEGSASGVWDTKTESAMQKLQADNGWQTKIVPDARGLIKLGLGPNTSVASEVPAESTVKPTFTQQ